MLGHISRLRPNMEADQEYYTQSMSQKEASSCDPELTWLCLLEVLEFLTV